MKLNTYEDWKRCITVLCRLAPTPDYIEQRLSDLKNPNDYATKKFKNTWGCGAPSKCNQLVYKN